MSRLEGQVANKRRYEPDDLNGDEDTAKKAKTEDLEVSSVNTTGLLSLPVEVFEIIYTELLSTSRLISREEVLANNPHLDDSFQYRTDVLRSLTQTCRALRASCLPRYYEQVEACVCRGARVWYKQLAERLEKTSWMLIENPHLAMHVQTVTVSLTRCSTATVLPAFAACLTALPNLHTLRIMHAHSQMTTSLKNAFEHISLPQIRAIILPSCAHNILRSCPNIQDLTCNEEDGSKLISAMTKSSRNVEVIDGIYIYEALVKRLAKAAPKLRSVNARNNLQILVLEKIKLLDTIHLEVRIDGNGKDDVEKDLKAQLAQPPQSVLDAKKVLAGNTVQGTKAVYITFYVRDFDKDTGPFNYQRHWKVGDTQKVVV